jgi:hypothetical protein
VPWLATLQANPFVRGAISGIGLVTGVAGVRDLVSVFSARRPADAAASPSITERTP